METKVCTKCKEELPATNEYFHGDNLGLYGLKSICKVCRKQYTKKWYEENKEQILEQSKQYYENNKKDRKKVMKQYYEENKELLLLQKRKYYKENKEQILEYKKQYLEENKERILGSQKQYREENKERILGSQKQYREENRKYFKEYSEQYYEENKELIIKRGVKYRKKRRKVDIGFRILSNCRSRLYLAIKGINKSAPTKELIGCTIEYLLEHLENQFQEGMSWDNYGEWHIDHIKPCALFDFTKEEEQRECFNYMNLQPLWAEDNLSKGTKYMEGTK